MALADLHTHTHYSDGTDSPQRLLEQVAAAGIAAVAITDHDTMAGWREAVPLAAAHNIELIPGIEMSSSWQGYEVHMLGFLMDPEHPGLKEFITWQGGRRIERVREMVKKLQAAGVKIEADDVFNVAGKGTIGRPHVAQALLNRGYVSTLREAFDRYIGNGGPGFVSGSSTTPAEVIRIIREAGGAPVLAHPMYLKDDSVIEQFVRAGLVGIEVYHSSHKPDLVLRYEQMAEKFGLLQTGGTDYHGSSKEGLPIGSTTVPYALVERLKEWQRKTTRAS